MRFRAVYSSGWGGGGVRFCLIVQMRVASNRRRAHFFAIIGCVAWVAVCAERALEKARKMPRPEEDKTSRALIDGNAAWSRQYASRSRLSSTVTTAVVLFLPGLEACLWSCPPVAKRLRALIDRSAAWSWQYGSRLAFLCVEDIFICRSLPFLAANWTPSGACWYISGVPV